MSEPLPVRLLPPTAPVALGAGTEVDAKKEAALRRWGLVCQHFSQHLESQSFTSVVLRSMVQARRAALVAAARGDVETETNSSSQQKLQKQGDLALYTLDSLSVRRKLMQVPSVTRHIRECWKELCEGTGSTGPSVLSAAGAIGRQEYAFFFTVCAKLLMPTEPVDLAVVEGEWDRDSSGSGVMDFLSFSQALFELVDMWTLSMNAEDYVHLLQEVRRGLRLALKSCGGRIESYLQAAEAEAVRCAAARASGASAGVSASRAASALDLLGGGSASEEEEAAAAWSRGLPKHTCAVDGKGSHRCVACILIREWEEARRRALQAMSQSGQEPWIGAWNMRPNTYLGGFADDDPQECVPVVKPGAPVRPTTVAPLRPVTVLPASTSSARTESSSPSHVQRMSKLATAGMRVLGQPLSLLPPVPPIELAPLNSTVDMNKQLREALTGKPRRKALQTGYCGRAPGGPTAASGSGTSPVHAQAAALTKPGLYSPSHFAYNAVAAAEAAQWPALDRASASVKLCHSPVHMRHASVSGGLRATTGTGTGCQKPATTVPACVGLRPLPVPVSGSTSLRMSRGSNTTVTPARAAASKLPSLRPDTGAGAQAKARH